MKVLVTGGAGYIGSFMVKRLIEKGDEVIVFDSLERGRKEAVDSRARFVQRDLKSLATLEDLFCQEIIDAVVHFAGYISVEESMDHPDRYYWNNVVGSQNLFDVAIHIGKVNMFVFSSSAAVYGNPKTVPIPENHPKNPMSFYGKTKLAIEETLDHLHKEEGISFVCLRYFNAAGAAFDGSNGELHSPETHIIPNAIRAGLSSSEFILYGDDYSTPDGTCIRDYVHVTDLVEAHVLAIEKLRTKNGGFFYNVGTGEGHSNREIITMVEEVLGVKIRLKVAARRKGDPEILVADPTKIRSELGFLPKNSDLLTIVRTACDWHRRNSK